MTLWLFAALNSSYIPGNREYVGKADVFLILLFSHIAHSGTYSYKSLLIQILSLSLKVLDKTDIR